MFEISVLAARAAPYEGCGIIHIDGSVTSCPNIFEGDRRYQFAMEVDFDFEVPAMAIWHSHPGGRPFMSDHDHAGICEMYRMGVELPWAIAAAGEIHVWDLDL